MTYIPYYGAAKGQTLQIVETSDGNLLMHIVPTPDLPKNNSAEFAQPNEFEMPPLPNRQELDYAYNLRNLHKTAVNIIRIQEDAKKKGGELGRTEEAEYRENLDSLNASAQNLTELYGEDEEVVAGFKDVGLSAWFDRKKQVKKDKDKKKEEEDKRKQEIEEEERKKAEEEEKRKEDEKRKEEEEKKEEEKKEQEKEKEQGEDAEDGVAINLPPPEASVAEARPVGLAIAGRYLFSSGYISFFKPRILLVKALPFFSQANFFSLVYTFSTPSLHLFLLQHIAKKLTRHHKYFTSSCFWLLLQPV